MPLIQYYQFAYFVVVIFRIPLRVSMKMHQFASNRIDTIATYYYVSSIYAVNICNTTLIFFLYKITSNIGRWRTKEKNEPNDP